MLLTNDEKVKILNIWEKEMLKMFDLSFFSLFFEAHCIPFKKWEMPNEDLDICIMSIKKICEKNLLLEINNMKDILLSDNEIYYFSNSFSREYNNISYRNEYYGINWKKFNIAELQEKKEIIFNILMKSVLRLDFIKFDITEKEVLLLFISEEEINKYNFLTTSQSEKEKCLEFVGKTINEFALNLSYDGFRFLDRIDSKNICLDEDEDEDEDDINIIDDTNDASNIYLFVYNFYIFLQKNRWFIENLCVIKSFLEEENLLKKFLLCNEPFFKLIFSENEINNYQKEILNKLNIEGFFIKNDQNDNELVITHKEFVKLYNEYDSYFKNKTILLTLLIEIEKRLGFKIYHTIINQIKNIEWSYEASKIFVKNNKNNRVKEKIVTEMNIDAKNIHTALKYEE